MQLRSQMKYDDSELIQQTLDGDEQAFAALVNKYQKQIHALAWQKIGDFHIAQEITQDTFLTAYQKLSTLANPKRFAGWLYVITNRKCITWYRRKKQQPQSLEETDRVELEEVYYSEYMTQQRETAANQKRRAIVQKLLSTLQESERTVVNMYYIAEMTCEDIGKFLGVSPNTVRSRLHRARNKMKKEESMIKENLSSFQLPTQLTETIMEKISQLNPVSPSGSKPLVPLAVSAVSALFVVLLMGVGAQNLFRFQKPYQLDAQSVPTIDIMETQLVIDTPAKPAVRAQIGSVNVPSNSNGEGQESDTRLLAAAQVDENEIAKPKRQWSDAKGPEGGAVGTLFRTNRGDVYATAKSGLYRLTDDKLSWRLISSIDFPSPTSITGSSEFTKVVEWQNTFYRAIDTTIFLSTDRGATWKEFCECIKGELVGMVITDKIQDGQSDMTIFLAYKKGIFRSDNAGKSWTPLPEGITDRIIGVIANVDKTVFIGTDKGLYRLNDDKWEQLSINQEKIKEKQLPVVALEVSGNHLYVATRKGIFGDQDPLYAGYGMVQIRTKSPLSGLGSNAPKPYVLALFHTDDHGDSWNTITPAGNNIEKKPKQKVKLTDIFPTRKKDSGVPYQTPVNTTINLSATGEKVIVIDGEEHFYSTNVGKTWKTLDNTNDMVKVSAVVLLNDNIFYRSGTNGIHRTTDGGKTWHQFNKGFVNTDVRELIPVNGTLYANTRTGLVSSADEGETWTPVPGDTGYLTRIIEYNGDLYVRDDKIGAPQFLRYSAKDNKLIHLSDIPDFKKVDYPEVVRKIPIQDRGPITSISLGKGSFYNSLLGCFAVNEGTYYVEYMHKLFKWEPGISEWTETGISDKTNKGTIWSTHNFFDTIGFKLALSGNTIYVGQQDGRLMQSLNDGNTWKDITANLPVPAEHFISIVFAGNFVYVATDKGVLLSGNGTDWHIISDAEGKPTFMKRLAVDDTTVYGESNQVIYQLNKNSGKWQQVTPEISALVNCLAVDDNTLYVGTFGQGVLRYKLEK